MLPKIFQYDGQFEHTGEARLQIVDRRDVRLHRNEKYASEDIWGKLSEVEPTPGKTTLLVLAMSAGEYYGPNRNGDAFSEKPVERNGTILVKPGEELPNHYKTFEKGHAFKHHINKDPAKALGDIIQSAYNWMMHRVELLVNLDNSKARDIVQRVDGGEFPGVSMGCKIDYDVCDLCGNKAPTRQQYCNHVSGKDPNYGMNALLPNGQRCFVWNPSPRFFDLSFVFKPADRIGYTMKKVADCAQPYELKTAAELGEQVEDLAEKRALLGKMSVIDKVIKGVAGKPEDAQELDEATKRFASEVAPNIEAPPVGKEALQCMSQYSLPEILSSYNAAGMAPSTPELFIIICQKDGLEPSQDEAARVGDVQGSISSILAQIPQALSALADTGILKCSEELVRPEILEQLQPYREKRALYREYLARRFVPESYGGAIGDVTGLYDTDQAYYEPTRSLLHFQDPQTRKMYATTRDAAEQADWSNKKKQLIEGAGLAGLLGVAYKTLGATGKTRWLRPAALAGSGALGYKLLKGQRMPQVQTLEGQLVPANTEFAEKQGSVRQTLTPIAGGALLTLLMAQDFRSNPHPNRVTRHAWENPIPVGIGATALAGGLTEGGRGALRSLFKRAEYNPANADNVNLDEVVRVIGLTTFPDLIA